MCVEAGTEGPSMKRENVWWDLFSDSGQMRVSYLSLLSLRKLACIQVFISVRQLLMVGKVVGVINLVEM